MRPLTEKIYLLLESYPNEFKVYFYDHARHVINFFSEAGPDQPIYDWLFSEANPAKLPSATAMPLINNIEGLSAMTGFSFIRQYKLADNLQISERWLRNLVSRIKNIGLIFSRKNKRINYAITFDLRRPIMEYFFVLTESLFQYFIMNINTDSMPCSSPCAASSSGSKNNSFIASLLYTSNCGSLSRPESVVTHVKLREEEASQAPSLVLGATEEKDHAENIVSLPATTHHVQQLPDQQPQPTKIEPAKPVELAEIEQPKGKFTFEQYKLFAESEKKRKGSIRNSDWFANYLLKTGLQDSQVARFLKVSLDSQKLKNSSLIAFNDEQSLSKEEIERRKMVAIGKEIFEQLEDWEQAELQDERLEGMDWFYGSSTVVQNAVMLGIREKIYLELAQAN